MGNVGGWKDDITLRWFVYFLTRYKVSLGDLIRFAGQDATDPITSMAMEGDAVWVAAGSNIIKYIRGKEVFLLLFLLLYRRTLFH